MIPSADNQPDDRFGHSCYALVIPASDPLIQQVDQLRQTAGMTRAAIPAHITVKGTFLGIESLEEVQHRVRAITAQTQPFYIRFNGAESSWWEGGGCLVVPVSSPLQALHDALVTAITPLGMTAYRDDPYRAHMTYVQDCSAEGLARAQEMVAAMDFGPGFQAAHVDLVARRGPAYGGAWEQVERFPLGGSDK